MATSDGWKVSRARLPLGAYMLHSVVGVRTRDGIFQVQVKRSLPLPCGDYADWVAEMSSYVAGLVDVTVECEHANEEYSTEINAQGWADATPEQVAILKEHDFSA